MFFGLLGGLWSPAEAHLEGTLPFSVTLSPWMLKGSWILKGYSQAMPSNPSEHIVFHTRGRDLIAHLTAPVINDNGTAEAIGGQLEDALRVQGSGVCTVQIDLAEVKQLGTAVLNRLIGFHHRACDQGLRVRLSSPQPQVRDILFLTRLDRLFEVDLDEATA